MKPFASSIGLKALVLLIGLSFAAQAELKTHFADGLYGRKMYDMALGEYKKLLAQTSAEDPQTTLLFRAGECARQLADWEAAQAYFTRALTAKGDPLFARRSRVRLGQHAISEGQWEQAKAMLAPAFFTEQDVVSAAGHYYFFEALLKGGEMKAAVEAAEALAKSYPDSVYVAHAALQLCESGTLNPSELIGVLEAAIQVDKVDAPIRSRLHLLRAENFEKLESLDQSRAAYVQLLADFPESSDAQEARLKAGWLYLKTKDFRHLLPMIQQLPAEEKKANEAAWVYLEANAYREMGNQKRSEQLYELMTQQWPDSPYTPYAAYEWAIQLFSVEKFAEVVALEPLMLRAKDQVSNVRWLLGEASAEQGRWPEAEGHFRALADLEGPEAQARSIYGLAQLTYIQEKWSEAGAAFHSFATQFKGSENAAAAYLKSGQAYYNAEMPKEAVASWSALIQQYPKHALVPDATKQAALLELDLKNFAAAETFFKQLKAQENEGYAIQANYWLGVLAQQDESRGDEESLPYLQEALAQDLDLITASRAAYRLGLIYFKQKQEDQAEAMLSKALEQNWVENLNSAFLIWYMERQLDAGKRSACIAAGDRLLKQAQILPQDLARATHAMGSAYLADGRRKDAQRFFGQAAASAAGGRIPVDAQLQVAQLLLEDGSVAEAQTAFEKAGTKASEGNFLDLQATSYYGLGELAERDERWEDASRYFMGVAILFDDAKLSPDSLKRAASAFTKQGKNSEAAQALEELKERYPDGEASEQE